MGKRSGRWADGSDRKRHKGGDGKGKKGGGKGKKGGKERGHGGGNGKPSRSAGRGPMPERAVMLSCRTPSMNRKATREAMCLLHSALDTLRKEARATVSGEVRATASDAGNGVAASGSEWRSVGDCLEAELRELRGDASGDGGNSEGAVYQRTRISFYNEPLRGLSLLAIPPGGAAHQAAVPAATSTEETSPGEVQGVAATSDSGVVFPAPSALVERIFKTLGEGREGGARAVRFVIRLIPLDFICLPHLKNFRAAIAASLPASFAGCAKDATYYISFNSRSMATIKREDALVAVKEVLKPLCLDISVSEPDYTILIEVNPTLCGFSVLRGFEEKLYECNLQTACAAHDLVEDDEDESDRSDSEDSEDEAGDAEKGAVVATKKDDGKELAVAVEKETIVTEGTTGSDKACDVPSPSVEQPVLPIVTTEATE